ncbi:hypothetical protein DFQ28_010879 [Apophysomyces sp. BC1034]|nr:hypothetical protein DFQ28_010879 [Apophysomyces sp. BC1034]
MVWDAPITSPKRNDKWRAGQQYMVKWETTVAGMKIPPKTPGTITLGYRQGSSMNEHLQWSLASGFDLSTGHVLVTLPKDLETRKRYIIVLFGDSGNASEEFTIVGTK